MPAKLNIYLFFKRFYLFLERGEGKEKERGRNIDAWLPLTWPPLGTWPTTLVCALTGNQTSDPLVCRLALSQQSHISQGEVFIYLFLRLYLFIFRDGGKEGEKYQCVVASHMPPTGDLVLNPSMCPDWELNWWPFGSQAVTQSTEPHQPGLFLFFNPHLRIF